MKNKIEIKNVSKTIEGTTILSEVSLSLEQGKIYGFVGKNGSGKTMLFRMLAGFVKCSSGKILYNEKEVIFGEKIPVSMGILIENAGMYPDFTGFENLKFLASICKVISEEQIKKAIDRVGLDHKDKRKVKKYSLGMKQRITLAQSIMEEPELLLLDEPTNALDAEGVEQIREVIRQEKERGAIICLASHNAEDIEILCDEIYRIKEGKVYLESNDEEKN